jgi:hypothetical protein
MFPSAMMWSVHTSRPTNRCVRICKISTIPMITRIGNRRSIFCATSCARVSRIRSRQNFSLSTIYSPVSLKSRRKSKLERSLSSHCTPSRTSSIRITKMASCSPTSMTYSTISSIPSHYSSTCPRRSGKSLIFTSSSKKLNCSA